MEKAIVKRVIGPVVDIHFPEGALPELYNAIEIQLEDRKVVLEVVQQIGGGDVAVSRCPPPTASPGAARPGTPAAPSPCPLARPPWAACST